MIDFNDSIDKCTLNEVSTYANYFINWFQNIRKVCMRGQKWNLDHLFSIILQSEIIRKMQFESYKSIYECIQSDTNSEVISEYGKELQCQDTTEIRLPYVWLTYYNSLNKTVTVIDAYKVHLEFLNDDWHQINEFVIVKHLKCLDIGHLNVKNDESTTKAIKDTINDCNLDEKSFVAIKTKFKLMNSLRSK